MDPATLSWGYDSRPGGFDRANRRCATCRQTGDLGAALALREPPFTHYARARRTLARYRAAAAKEPRARPAAAGGPEEGRARPGRGTVCPSWPRGCARSGTSRATHRLRASYERPLVDAVKGFQRRHGLEPDGVLGQGTIATLNVTIAHRVRQIQLAMERMRWLPEMSDRPTVFVNVPLFRLWATDPGTGAASRCA